MIERISDRVDWRVSVTAATGVVVGVSMVLLGMEPRLLLVGVVVVVVAAAAALAIDLGAATSPIAWKVHDRGSTAAARPDQRVQALRARLRSPARRRRITQTTDDDRPEPVNEVVGTLLRVIDDHLLAEHSIDRSVDPAAAAAILGPDLTRFVTDPSARRSMTGRRRLARTLTLIEDL